jgi:dihydroorotate dehydrogenase electron transfer subunit
VDILCEKEFQALGWDVRVTTEDGSHGEKGLVTKPLLAELRSSRGNEAQTEKLERSQSLLTSAPTQKLKIYACGPTGMLKAVGKIVDDFNVPAELSMDEHMCCGVGVCLTCVIPIKTGNSWEYQRTCTEGPVFDARQVAWETAK